jgi:hypothetical protein
LARASYDLNERFSVEGTFSFSPAGRSSGGGAFVFESISDFLDPDPLRTLIPLPSIRGKDTYHYAGNAVFHWRLDDDWAPFITGGLGAVQRTADLVVPELPTLPMPSGPGLQPFPLPLPPDLPPPPSPVPPSRLPSLLITTVPSPGETGFSVNFGAGVKKYFSDGWGIRFDFRDYVSSSGEDTVNNMEVSLGLIVRL